MTADDSDDKKPLPGRWECFWMGVIAGIIFTLAFVPLPTQAADDVEHWIGLNTWSRHFTADNDRYCETNPGVFYEHRWDDRRRGLQVGYYRNSFCDRQNEDRIDDTFYAVGIYQPWRWKELAIGGFAGAASGYKKGNLVFIAGALLTWTWDKPGIGVQAIVNPAVGGLQPKMRF